MYRRYRAARTLSIIHVFVFLTPSLLEDKSECSSCGSLHTGIIAETDRTRTELVTTPYCHGSRSEVEHSIDHVCTRPNRGVTDECVQTRLAQQRSVIASANMSIRYHTQEGVGIQPLPTR